MTTTPDGGRTLHDSKSNLALTKSDNSSADAELAAHVEKPPQVPAPSPFPEGGLQAWLTVLGGSMILFCTFGTVQSFGVYQAYYFRRHFPQPTPSSPLTSVFSPITFRRAGSLIYLFSIFMLSLAKPHQYYQIFLAQGIGMGIGMGLLFLPAISVTSHYFRRRRAAAMGVVLAGKSFAYFTCSSLGAVIYSIMLNNLFNGSAGYAWGVRAAGFIDLVLLVTANLVMKTRLPSRRERPDAKPVDVKAILSDFGYWLCIIGATLTFWGLFVPFFYLQVFSEKHGLSKTSRFLRDPHYERFFNIRKDNSELFRRRHWDHLTVCRIIYRRHTAVMIPCTIISGGLLFLMFAATNLGGTIAFGILYGFFSGGFISLITPAAASYSKDLNEIGIRIGITSFVISFALLTGNPIAGAVVQVHGSYIWYRPLVFASVVVLAGAACLTASAIHSVQAQEHQQAMITIRTRALMTKNSLDNNPDDQTT
ncbi:MFS general substrate transporter [Suillus occidentalis]|nr:MFS general substrate transporter [Suillus occidentalis]